MLTTKNAQDIMSTKLSRAAELSDTKDLNFKNYFGLGVPGALAYAGVKGRLVFDQEIKEKGIAIGSPLQYWWDDGYNNVRAGQYASGHTGIAMGNKVNESGELLGIRFWDQVTLNDTQGPKMPGTLWKYGSTNEMLPFVGVSDPNTDSSVRTYFGFSDGTRPGTYPLTQWAEGTSLQIASGQFKLLLIGFEFK